MNGMLIFGGRASESLATHIAHAAGTHLSGCIRQNFSDAEIWVKYRDNIRGSFVYIVQSTMAPAENLLELLIMIDAAKRASARKVVAVIPYFGYARQDRKDQPRVSITAKLVANLLTAAGADRIITMDLHASQIQGFFDIPVDHLYGSAVLLKKIKRMRLNNLAVASADVGGIKMARAYAKRLNAELIVIDKRRPSPNAAEVMNIMGTVKGRNIFVIDDLIDTASTLCNAVNALKERGARDVYAAATHAIFSGQALANIRRSPIKALFTTDTIPREYTDKNIRVLSVAHIFAEAINRAYKHRSISNLFYENRD